jgi:hypothetical protein
MCDRMKMYNIMHVGDDKVLVGKPYGNEAIYRCMFQEMGCGWIKLARKITKVYRDTQDICLSAEQLLASEEGFCFVGLERNACGAEVSKRTGK